MINVNHQPPHWLAVHLYAAEPWETLLGHGIQPVVQALHRDGLSESFLFYRSWTGQPHLRLYFESRTEQAHTTLQPRIEHYFRHDFAHRLLSTSNADRFAYRVDFLTVDFPAMPMTAAGMQIAVSARYWRLLSQVTLDLFAQNLPWSAARGLTAALQLHLGFAWALGLDWAATGAFYRAAGIIWSNNDAYPAPETSHHPLKLNHFAGRLHEQQHKLDSYCRALWDALQLAAPFDEPWFQHWLCALHSMRHELQPLLVPACDPQRWTALVQHVHLINNQLGIVQQDEALLCRLLAHVPIEPKLSWPTDGL